MLRKSWKIISDGTPQGTKVIDPDGKPLQDYRHVHWWIDADDIGHATVELVGVKIDAAALVMMKGYQSGPVTVDISEEEKKALEQHFGGPR